MTRATFPVLTAFAAAAALLVGGAAPDPKPKSPAVRTRTRNGEGHRLPDKQPKGRRKRQVTIKTEEGEVQFGGEAKLPAGITPYPGQR